MGSQRVAHDSATLTCIPFFTLYRIHYNLVSVFCVGVFGLEACRTPAPRSGMEPVPPPPPRLFPTSGSWGPSYWTLRKVADCSCFNSRMYLFHEMIFRIQWSYRWNPKLLCSVAPRTAPPEDWRTGSQLVLGDRKLRDHTRYAERPHTRMLGHQ